MPNIQQKWNFFLNVIFTRLGNTECPLMPLNESIILAEINDEIRKQLGVRYEQDEAI